MTLPTADPQLQPPIDTLVGGVFSKTGENPWTRKSGPEPEKPKGGLSDPEQPWLRDVLREIGQIADLKEDWDGYRAGPIRTDVLWYALRLLQSVMEDFPPPQLTPMSHEGILLEWHRDGVLMEIEIESAGEGYVVYENEESGIDDEWRVSADFRSLLEPLRAIAGKGSALSTTAF